ncbi:BatA domain-containing protein [bacterium]|nr:BatA domain-containing protein [bacterium]
MLTLANPLGLLALLGIPAVLAIHFLQRKAVELPVSTLFLLERSQRDAASGRRLERIIPSIPLWMQLLSVLLLAWFLAEPRLRKSASVQRIAVVLDSSASMGVFKTEAITRLAAELPKLQGPASTVELIVFESAPDRPRLYAGSSVEKLMEVLEKWRPLDGLVDPTQALRLARSLVSHDGTVIYLTDTPAGPPPFAARLIAVGTPVENVGFTGVSFSSEEGSLVWRALVRNYSKTAVDRTWLLQTAGGSSEARPLHLAAGALVTLQAAFPAEAKNVRLVLSADRFALDDTLPLVAPQPKSLALLTATSLVCADLTNKLLRALEAAVATTDAAAADLTITSAQTSGNSILFVDDSPGGGSYLKGGIVAEPHPLLDGLNWQSLLVRETRELDRLPTDKVLLWQDKRPLIFLRQTPTARQLCFNFDLRHSNAASQPAFIVLLHRFAETVREAKFAATAANLETGQAIQITVAPGLPLQATASDSHGNPLPLPTSTTRAPATPGFLTVRQNETLLLDAAAHFADTREADFSACGTSDLIPVAHRSAIERHTVPDPLWRVWILLLIAALLVSWNFTKRKATA